MANRCFATTPLSAPVRGTVIIARVVELCQSDGMEEARRCGIMKHRKGAAAAVSPYSESNIVGYVDRLGASQAVSMLL